MKPVIYSLLSPSERRRIRELYIIEQGGLCMYCKGSLSERPPKEMRKKPIKWALFPPNFLKYPVHLQHDHETGLTEGAVHALCNAILWQYHGR